MSHTTTVPHLVLERYPHIARAIEMPEDIQGNTNAEHQFLFPILMRDYRTEWEIICEEVDTGLEDGVIIFNGETGEITLLRQDMKNMKYIVFGAILVIYLDWTRLLTDIQNIIGLITTEVQTHEQTTD